ncbi:hypothetical protein O3G_MSEX002286 [Manduca sexta]|uniref:Uncharacterized protein n=1 Tax=Manduca sexta TaxID=7130 RepID=A0A921YNP1_MANSE|nr:hypothetical protein O3G_MSEX002286 [Manduca sexta]
MEFLPDMAIGLSPIMTWLGTHMAKSGCPGCAYSYPFGDKCVMMCVCDIEPLYRHCISCEPIATSCTNSSLRADTHQKNLNITLLDLGFEPRILERCRTARAVDLRHRERLYVY